jgi:hypothetical protein
MNGFAEERCSGSPHLVTLPEYAEKRNELWGENGKNPEAQ